MRIFLKTPTTSCLSLGGPLTSYKKSEKTYALFPRTNRKCPFSGHFGPLLAQFGPNEKFPEKPDFVILELMDLYGDAKNLKKLMRHFHEKIKNINFLAILFPF